MIFLPELGSQVLYHFFPFWPNFSTTEEKVQTHQLFPQIFIKFNALANGECYDYS